MKFKNKTELFRYLHENRADLIQQKKQKIKFSDPSFPITNLKGLSLTEKYAYSNDEASGKLTRTIIGNTYNWMDSQSDVLLSGVFSRSINDSKRMYHLHDHIHELDARVGIPQSFSEKDISWRALGLGRTGMTQALFMETEIQKALNQSYYDSYLNDQVDQHSVALQYVKIDLAMNDSNYNQEYAVWQDVIGKIGNKAEAEAQGFFFAVREAKLYEVSAVMFGANELTPTLRSRDPEKSTHELTVEPGRPTQLMKEVTRLNKMFNAIKI